MNRYKFTSTLQEATPRKGTLVYPYIPEHPEDIYVISTMGDRLDILARDYYGDSELWWVIASANPSLRRDTLQITPGIQLRIPHSRLEAIKKLTEENNQR